MNRRGQSDNVEQMYLTNGSSDRLLPPPSQASSPSSLPRFLLLLVLLSLHLLLLLLVLLSTGFNDIIKILPIPGVNAGGGVSFRGVDDTEVA